VRQATKTDNSLSNKTVSLSRAPRLERLAAAKPGARKFTSAAASSHNFRIEYRRGIVKFWPGNGGGRL